ncbi:hypothetical protein DND132_2304 [Pseudodesulfovibrio mercurii]|uniref:Lipoprotein n=1 Tax=Pseudodesulfovibrio mercurii TaxID=641491 RepID=F0JBK5_9BACT|nr:hypothetical protein [Pseudodesulfovibrio mercurii]EGB15508.1 hypothetical protein DND132_2304 [Pseudodesulfovibrio mercurii]
MRIRLLALTLALLFATCLTACSAKDEAAQQPVPDQAAAQATPADGDQAAASTTRAIQEVIPEGPLGQVQLRNGSTLKIDALQKLGGDYWVYVTGKLNGRSSTVVSLTRFRDLMNWQSIVFQDPHTFTITNRQGKEWAFEEANFYLGSDKPGTYAFYVLDDRLDQVLTEVDKGEVANIDFLVK